MKSFKLIVHQKQFSEDELVLNLKEFPDVCIGDIVEIYHPEDGYSRLLLQVKAQKEEQSTNKETVSINQAIAQEFKLRTFQDVYVNKINPKDVALDLVELNFKDQYFGRSEMWRLRCKLVNSCVYLTKKLEFAQMSAKVGEMWAKGEKVTCGVVTDDTRLAYRSLTAVYNLFIQMSLEMWDFDPYGDLYFEKAVNGFLKDMFAKWQEKGCCHDVTIVMFSRTFYDAHSLDEFPEGMRECIQVDYQGRYYEDFCRVVIQNERFEDWTSTIIKLKELFIEYPDRVLNYHKAEYPNQKIPQARNSTAAEGNFLEVLNMSLNLFERYYIDRIFDRTCKASVVITPGAGVFEVDRELNNITKQRSIDCGAGSDLVCMGEQPLHVVPLFKFHNKYASVTNDVGDDYNIPHWVNHSFYQSRSQLQLQLNSKFVPRTKPTPLNHSEPERDIKLFSNKNTQYFNNEDQNFPFMDYDEYDSKIFFKPNTQSNVKLGTREIRSSPAVNKRLPHSISEARRYHIPRTRHISDEFSFHSRETREKSPGSTQAIGIPAMKSVASAEYFSTSLTHVPENFVSRNSTSSSTTDRDDDLTNESERLVVGSAGSPVGYQCKSTLRQDTRQRRALINPFQPATMKFKLTSNRRRWVHVFPIGPSGSAMQSHHYHSESTSDSYSSSPSSKDMLMQLQRSRIQSDSEESSSYPIGHRGRSPTVLSTDSADSQDTVVKLPTSQSNASLGLNLPQSMGNSVTSVSAAYDQGIKSSKSSGASGYFKRVTHDDMEKSFAWGPTGEQEWTPEMYTAVDWKSLTSPASLPITTDYLPDKNSLQIDYVINEYPLLPDNYNMELWSNRKSVSEEESKIKRKPLTTQQVFREMVNQRIARGFQMIVKPHASSRVSRVIQPQLTSAQNQLRTGIRARSRVQQTEEYYLSIGRIFHKISLTGSTITVTCYKPRHPYPQKTIQSKYRFQCPDSFKYDVSWTEFSNEKVENYNWNYLDQYICTRGEGEFSLMESLKYWRSRLYLLPCNNQATKRIVDGSTRCDIFEACTEEENNQLIDGFLRFVETINKIRRPGQTRKPKRSRRASLTTIPALQHRDKAERERFGSRPGAVSPIPPEKAFYSQMSDNQGVTGTPVQVLDLKKSATYGSPLSLHEPSQSYIHPSATSVRMGESIPSRGELPPPAPADEIVHTLSLNSSSQDIIAGMIDTHEGLSFLTKQAGLPSYCFVSFEAVAWVKCYLEGAVTDYQAIEILQRLITEGYVIHASGNPRHKFIHGFYLYCIMTAGKEKGKDVQSSLSSISLYENTSFQYEWCEIAIHSHNLHADHANQLASSSSDPNLQSRAKSTWDSGAASSPTRTQYLSGAPMHKYVNVDIDPNEQSDRPEWGTARYHGHYHPNCGFELEVCWMVATGCILGDLMNNWVRRAGAYGFHLVPVPSDPFALPYTPQSDPLRGPIFVPLNVDALKNENGKIFPAGSNSDVQEQQRVHDQLYTFQEKILARFGFMRDRYSPDDSGHNNNEPQQFIHCTGGMFTLIPDSRSASPRPSSTSYRKQSRSSSLHKDYIAKRNRTDSFSSIKPDPLVDIGFLWSWNHLLSKKWRSSNTGDDEFRDKMLADFRAFCQNDNNRLKEFYQMETQGFVTEETGDCNHSNEEYHGNHSNGEYHEAHNGDDTEHLTGSPVKFY
ncbi:unnamed protein product [Owenia fusiformis]|uniref:Uncharacterized protein n=1 Tax=Owenia fusiformis TaxID=6347 RepID=A0A8J1YAU8_OWEFU|nr:unnamed protein product [Owenia fusiformis]